MLLSTWLLSLIPNPPNNPARIAACHYGKGPNAAGRILPEERPQGRRNLFHLDRLHGNLQY
jgi:hypothetical protein